MPDTPNLENVEDLSPYRLLRNFSKNRVLHGSLLALIIHLAVIGGLSTGYIYQTWINPLPPVQKADAENPDGAPNEETDPADGTKPEDDTNPTNGDDPKPGSPEETDATPPVIERVTDVADPEDFPKEPDGLGISIDDINE
jgi:hypothetical protein